MLKAIKIDVLAIEYSLEDLRDVIVIILAAVQSNGMLLKFVSEDFRN